MTAIEKLLEIMQQLRDPENGCPWDLQQDFSTIAPYTVEEAYEVADAIEHNDMNELKKELGDLLFQVVFHAQLATEQSAFTFDDVVEAINEKMIRRHPHVFGDEQVSDVAEQQRSWEDIKRQEREAHNQQSLMDGISKTLPALNRAKKMQLRASSVGFDWPDLNGVMEKIIEELDEVRAAQDDRRALQEEIGDLLFSCVNLARFLHVDPEVALRHSNQKFDNRFRSLEQRLIDDGINIHEATLEELDKRWDCIKSNNPK